MDFGSIKRIALGFLAAIAVFLALAFLPPTVPAELAMKRFAGFFYVWPAIYGLPKIFAMMFVGAYVARTRFVGPAVLLSVLGWAIAVYALNQSALGFGQQMLADIVFANMVGLFIQMAGAVLGAIAGERFYSSRRAGAVDAG
jgi:hypothetical protein